MRYDFDRIIDRCDTNSSKWDNCGTLFGRDDVLPMWVADMDLPCPEPVVRAIKERAAHPIYGYTFPSAELYQAIVDWNQRHYGWAIKREWIVFTAGVVNGLYSAIKAFTHPGDEIVVQPPVYYPFSAAIKNTGCQVLHNQLRLSGGRYEMDFDGLRALFRGRTSFPPRSPKIKMLILCSPHNPVGRVWTADELRTLASICRENGVILVSDEIHCDLLLYGSKHTNTSTLSPEIESNTITLNSVSKTFNLAGMHTSYVVIPNPVLRRKYVEQRAGNCAGNLFGYTAIEAAYREGDDYLAQLNTYLQGNMDMFIDGVRTRLPGVEAIEPEGTYLAWLDMRGLGLNAQELEHLIRQKARLAFDDGWAFGPGGEGFQRVNLACPRSYVAEALDRLEGALKGL